MATDEQAGNGSGNASIWVKVDMAMASGADGVLIEAFPVVRMGGLSPAYYPAGPEDEPDAYVFVLPDPELPAVPERGTVERSSYLAALGEYESMDKGD